jgi:hypothetical protein
VNSSTEFNLTASDHSGSGIAGIWYRIDSNVWTKYTGNFTISTSGSHTIFYNSTDNLRQSGPTKSHYVFVDNEPPSTAINAGDPRYGSSPTYFTSETGFNLIATDDVGSGVASIWFKIDTRNWILYTSEFTVSSEGLHTIYYYSIDNLGQEEATRIYEIIVDDTPPTTSVVKGLPNYVSGDVWVTSSTQFTLDVAEGEINPVGVNYTMHQIWDGSWSDWFIFTGAFLLGNGDGIRYVEFYSVDLLGNAEPINNRTYIVDNTPPSTTIIIEEPNYREKPDDILNITSSTTIVFSFTDYGLPPVGSDYTEYRIWNNGIWSEWFRFSSEMNLGSENGVRYIEWYSVDKLGNKETTNNLTVFVDNSPPTTDYIVQLEPDNSEARVSLISSDIGSQVAFTKYRVDSGIWITYSGTFLINEPGQHTISFFSKDNLGNIEKEKNFTVKVEKTEPVTPPDVKEKETNYKPLIAFLFAIILLIAGTFISMKRPLKIVKENKMYTLLLVVLPFVVAEAATGVISFFTGILSVPPLWGLGMLVDLTILVVGLILFYLAFHQGVKLGEDELE